MVGVWGRYGVCGGCYGVWGGAMVCVCGHYGVCVCGGRYGVCVGGVMVQELLFPCANFSFAPNQKQTFFPSPAKEQAKFFPPYNPFSASFVNNVLIFAVC